MKIGVFTVLFGQKPFEDALDYIQSKGIQAVEIGSDPKLERLTESVPGFGRLQRAGGSSDRRARYGSGIEPAGSSCHLPVSLGLGPRTRFC